MNSVKFNKATKEIEIKGSRSFIESNFDIIGKFPIKSSEVKNAKGSARTRAHWRVVISLDSVEPQKNEAVKTPEVIDTLPAEQATPLMETAVPQEPKAKRPPTRKYFNTCGKLIRSEDTSTDTNPVINAVEKIPKWMSISSLKVNFGLSKDKVKEIIEEAEKQGKVRRDMDGSFVWCSSDEEM